MEPDVRQRIDNTGKRYRNKDKVAKNKRSAEGAENAGISLEDIFGGRTLRGGRGERRGKT